MPHIYWIPAGLLLLSWLLPLHVLPWLSWHNELLATFALLSGCGFALYVVRRQPASQNVLVPTLALLPLLLAAVAVLQWLAGRIVYGGSVLVILSYALVAVGAAAAGHAAGRVPAAPVGQDALARVLVLAALLQWLVAFSQVMSLWMGADWVARTGYDTRAGGNFAQPNQAGLLFVLGIVATVHLVLTRELRKAVGTAALLMLAAGLAATQSRSALLATAVLVLGVLWRRGLFGDRRGVLLAAGYLTLVALLFEAWPHLMAAYWMQPADAVNLTTSGRAAMWAQLLEAVQMRPWWGWGVMQVAEAQNAIADRFPAVMASTFSHNALLDIALWAGVPALVVCVYLVAAWLPPRLRAIRSPDTFFSAAVALPVLTQSMTEFPYAYTFFIVPAFFALGLLDASLGHTAGLSLRRNWVAFGLAVATALYVWAAIEYVRVEEDFRVARFEALSVGATPQAYGPPPVVLLTQLGALLEATRTQPRPGMTAEEISRLEAIAMLHPWGATSFRYLTALALNGRMDEARRQLGVLRALHGRKTYEGILAVLGEMAARYPVLRQLQAP